MNHKRRFLALMLGAAFVGLGVLLSVSKSPTTSQGINGSEDDPSPSRRPAAQLAARHETAISKEHDQLPAYVHGICVAQSGKPLEGVSIYLPRTGVEGRRVGVSNKLGEWSAHIPRGVKVVGFVLSGFTPRFVDPHASASTDALTIVLCRPKTHRIVVHVAPSLEARSGRVAVRVPHDVASFDLPPPGQVLRRSTSVSIAHGETREVSLPVAAELVAQAVWVGGASEVTPIVVGVTMIDVQPSATLTLNVVKDRTGSILTTGLCTLKRIDKDQPAHVGRVVDGRVRWTSGICPGTYRVTVDAGGYARWVSPDLVVTTFGESVGATARLRARQVLPEVRVRVGNEGGPLPLESTAREWACFARRRKDEEGGKPSFLGIVKARRGVLDFVLPRIGEYDILLTNAALSRALLLSLEASDLRPDCVVTATPEEAEFAFPVDHVPPRHRLVSIEVESAHLGKFQPIFESAAEFSEPTSPLGDGALVGPFLRRDTKLTIIVEPEDGGERQRVHIWR